MPVAPQIRVPATYRRGGTSKGVVFRVEVQEYSHSQRSLLAVTVDAAINSGNSGGPVIQDNQIIGVAFQSLEDAENIGEVIPMPVIKHFLLHFFVRSLYTVVPDERIVHKFYDFLDNIQY